MNTWETIAIIIIYFWRGRTWRDTKGLFFSPIGYRNVPKGWTRQWYFASAQRCDPSHFFSSYSACLSLKFLDKAPAGIDAYRERERERKKNEEVRLDKQMTDNHQPACTHTHTHWNLQLFTYLFTFALIPWMFLSGGSEMAVTFPHCLSLAWLAKATAITAQQESVQDLPVFYNVAV